MEYQPQYNEMVESLNSTLTPDSNVIYENNPYGNRNGNKYDGKYGIKTNNLKSGKNDTQSDAEDDDFEIESLMQLNQM